MSMPRLLGAGYSAYVRIARLALAEKQLAYEHVPVDVFAAGGPPAWYLEHQPFGKIPAFEHDGLRLYETAAITRYVDEAFPGPALQPADVRRRATMTQIVSMLDSYGYRPMVWDVYVERIDRPREGKTPDEARIASGLAKSRACLAALAGLKAPGDWLLGEQLTLADLHAAPIFAYFAKAPEGDAAIAEFATLAEWWRRIQAWPSFAAVCGAG